MKIMFISDIHGDVEDLKIVSDIYRKEKVDKVIVLGDVYGFYDNDEELVNVLSSFQNIIMLKGNCDSEVDCMTSSIPFYDHYYDETFSKKFYCSHGNKYNISRYPNVEFDVLVSGHTHIGMIEKYDNKLFINPGSISRPRGGTPKSFIVIDNKGIDLRDLDNNTIEKYEWWLYNNEKEK